MDRRQLLLGMAATGLAAQLDLNPLTAQTLTMPDSPKKARRTIPPDTESKEPRGPIKSYIETTSYDRGVRTNIHEYAPDGKLVSWRMERDGKLEYSSDGDHSTEVRDPEGRLTKFVSRHSGQPVRETYFTYDTAGRMLTTTNNENSDRIDYSYAPDGTMSSTHTFDPKTLEGTRNTAFAGSAWEAAVYFGNAVPTGGTVRVTYDKDKNGTEMRVLSPDGQIVLHMTRKFDEDGYLLEDKTVEQNLALVMLDRMPAEYREHLTPEALAAMNRGIAGLSRGLPQTTYSYDDEGRLIQKFEGNMAFEQTMTIRYNEHGDRIEERTTYQDNSRFPMGTSFSFDAEGNAVPDPSAQQASAVRYVPPDTLVQNFYQYDDHGNWTERLALRDGVSSTTTRRTLTYY